MVRLRTIALLLFTSFSIFTHAIPVKPNHIVRRGGEPTTLPGSVYDFFFKDQTAASKALDTDNADYDLFKLLFTFAGEEDLLKSTNDGKGFTLFAPTDGALIQSAKDIIQIFRLSKAVIPAVEADAWKVYQAWFETMEKPKATVSRILKFHIVIDRELTLTDLLDNPTLNTTSGGILLSGTKLRNGDKRFREAKLDPELLMDCQFTMENGIIHPIDRMLFPDPEGDETDPEHVPPASQATPSPTPVPTSSPPGEPEPGSVDSFQGAPRPSTADGPSGEENAACFPASAIVHLRDGSNIPISQLSAGHEIMSSTMDRLSSPVYLFSHREHAGLHEFVRISSSHGHQITLTPGHYIYANGRKTAASRVKLGDSLQTVDGESFVTSITKVREKGLFAPHTLHGDIVVNGILASSYTTAVSPRIAHMLLWPLRMLVRTGIAVEPLGGLLYHGSPRLAAIIPRGYDVY